MVTTDNYESIMEDLGFKKINDIFLNSRYNIVAKTLINNKSILFSLNDKKEKITIDGDFRDNLCRLLNSAFKIKISFILNKISQ
jgi:hypothetical protein